MTLNLFILVKAVTTTCNFFDLIIKTDVSIFISFVSQPSLDRLKWQFSCLVIQYFSELSIFP